MGQVSQACPPSLPDIRQAGGRRVWARGSRLENDEHTCPPDGRRGPV